MTALAKLLVPWLLIEFAFLVTLARVQSQVQRWGNLTSAKLTVLSKIRFYIRENIDNS